MNCLEKLRQKFNLFKFRVEFNNDLSTDILVVSDRKDMVRKTFYFKDSRLSSSDFQNLVYWHSANFVGNFLENEYPELSIMESYYENGIRISVWLKRGGVAAEYLDTLDLLDTEFYNKMNNLQTTARVCLQPEWFYCCGCKEPDKNHDGMYSWFAGRYCKRYGDENPQHRDAARKET